MPPKLGIGDNNASRWETIGLAMPSHSKNFGGRCSSAVRPEMRPHSSRLNLFPALLFTLASALCVPKACAASSTIPHGTIELISENRWIESGHSANLGLRFQLEKGWHIYWVNPGDSGQPPRVKWQLPKGLAVGEVEWPAPHRLGTATIVDYGYEGSVTLIVPVHADANSAAAPSAQISAQVSVLVCREMCVPGKAQLSLTLPVKSQPAAVDSNTEPLFNATRASLPRPAPSAWKFSITESKDSFLLSASLGREVTQAVFYPLAESQIDNAAPQKIAATATGFRLTLKKSDQLLKPINQLKGVLVLGKGAYVIDAPVIEATARNDANKLRPAKSVEKGL
jgi:DsbC/DsbD-like thiol-disulfide interchange protein